MRGHHLFRYNCNLTEVSNVNLYNAVNIGVFVTKSILGTGKMTRSFLLETFVRLFNTARNKEIGNYMMTLKGPSQQIRFA